MTPPRRWEGSCAAPSRASSHAHPHTHRRRWLEGSSTWSLLCLCEACSTRSLTHLGALVEDVLHQRWREQPSAPLDPRLQRLLPF